MEETAVRRDPREAAARTTAKEAKDPSRQVDLRSTHSLHLLRCIHTTRVLSRVRRDPREAAAQATAKEAKDPSRQVDLRITHSLHLLRCIHTMQCLLLLVTRLVVLVLVRALPRIVARNQRAIVVKRIPVVAPRVDRRVLSVAKLP